MEEQQVLIVVLGSFLTPPCFPTLSQFGLQALMGCRVVSKQLRDYIDSVLPRVLVQSLTQTYVATAPAARLSRISMLSSRLSRLFRLPRLSRVPQVAPKVPNKVPNKVLHDVVHEVIPEPFACLVRHDVGAVCRTLKHVFYRRLSTAAHFMLMEVTRLRDDMAHVDQSLARVLSGMVHDIYPTMTVPSSANLRRHIETVLVSRTTLLESERSRVLSLFFGRAHHRFTKLYGEAYYGWVLWSFEAWCFLSTVLCFCGLLQFVLTNAGLNYAICSIASVTVVFFHLWDMGYAVDWLSRARDLDTLRTVATCTTVVRKALHAYDHAALKIAALKKI